MRNFVQKDDYIGFTFNGIHSSQFGIKSVSNGDRYQRYLSPEFSDIVSTVNGSDFTYYFGTKKDKRTIGLQIAFDDLTERELKEMRRWLDGGIADLTLDEVPYITYSAKLASMAQISFIPFSDDGDNRVYKGELELSFICYYPYGRSTYKYLDQYAEKQKEEWRHSIDLLPSQKSFGLIYDSVVVDETSNTKKIIVYNPGDLPCNFGLQLPCITDSTFTITLQTGFNTKNRQSTGTIAGYLNFNFSSLANKAGSNKVIFLDTEKRLLWLEYDIITDDVTEHFQEPINYCITGGDYFKIPVNESLEEYSEILFSADSTTADSITSLNTGMVYDYKFI